MKKLIVMIIMGTLMGVGFAAKAKHAATSVNKPERSYPIGCQTVGYDFKYGTLALTPVTPNHSQSIYFIQNISGQPLQVWQVKDGSEPYTMYNNTDIQAGQWASYATDQAVTRFICLKNEKTISTRSIMDCGKLLKICQYPNVKFALNNRGNYWAITNQSMRTVIHEVIRQGILLKR